MKKILLVLMALIFSVGCSLTSPNSNKTNVIEFVGKDDKSLHVNLLSNDDFETAVLTDNKGHKYNLKNAVSASGTRLANEKEKVEISFKKGFGVVNFGGKDIFLTYKQ